MKFHDFCKNIWENKKLPFHGNLILPLWEVSLRSVRNSSHTYGTGSFTFPFPHSFNQRDVSWRNVRIRSKGTGSFTFLFPHSFPQREVSWRNVRIRSKGTCSFTFLFSHSFLWREVSWRNVRIRSKRLAPLLSCFLIHFNEGKSAGEMWE